MKHLLPILSFLLAACITPAGADPSECRMSPLDEFANSPRRYRNDDGSEVVSSGLVKLGPGIVASRPNGAPGETTFATIDAPGVAALQAQINTLGEQLRVLLANLGLDAEETAMIREPTGTIHAPAFIGNIKAAPASNLSLIAEDGTQAARVQTNDAVTATLAILAGKVGFYQETPIDQQTVPIGATTDDVISALQALGLVKES
jgi:hypothetical protein